MPLFPPRIDERLGCRGAAPADHFFERRVERLEQILRTDESARFDERRADHRVALGKCDRLLGRAKALADIQPHIEQILRHPPGEFFSGAARGGIVEDHQIDVREGRHLPPAVPAVGHQHAFDAQRFPLAPELFKRRPMQVQHDRINQRRKLRADLRLESPKSC